MKPYFFNPLNINPIDVARNDYLEFFVEAILDHKGTNDDDVYLEKLQTKDVKKSILYM
jgi:hypothetical protein